MVCRKTKQEAFILGQYKQKLFKKQKLYNAKSQANPRTVRPTDKTYITHIHTHARTRMRAHTPHSKSSEGIYRKQWKVEI